MLKGRLTVYKVNICRLYYRYCLFSIKVNNSSFNSSIRVCNFCISVVPTDLCISIRSSIIPTRNLGSARIPSGSLGSVVIACKTIAPTTIVR